jgi:hypothetical protein
LQKNEKAIQAGWLYNDEPHPVINQHFAYKDTNAGRQIMFEDKTFYTEKEVKLLQDYGGLKNVNVHNVKKVFDGEIVKIKNVTFL